MQRIRDDATQRVQLSETDEEFTDRVIAESRRPDLTCARCDQPIQFRELYHTATRAAMIESANGGASAIVAGETVTVHDYPCPTRIGAPDRYAKPGRPTCCGGGPQWGHAWSCPKCPG